MACHEHLVFWPSCFSDVPSGSGCAQLKLVAYERLEGQAAGRATGAITPSMKLVLSVHAHILIDCKLICVLLFSTYPAVEASRIFLPLRLRPGLGI